jgi:SulP family sulfate permease
VKRYYRVNRPDFIFFMGAMLGILFLGIIQGIVIGVALSLLLLVARASRPGIRRLGRKPGSDAYLDVERHRGLEEFPGIVVVRVDGPLFFADANRFRDGVRELIAYDGNAVEALVVDAEAVSLTDTDGADMLIELAQELRAKNASLALARVQSSILDLWRRGGVVDAIGSERTFHTVHEAVESVRRPSRSSSTGPSG